MNYEPADDVVLKPCPFCGGSADISEGTMQDDTPWWYVECTKCSATADEVEVWNKRANPNHSDALAAIEQVLNGAQPVDIPGALMVARSALKG